jgi:hypothetical protein
LLLFVYSVTLLCPRLRVVWTAPTRGVQKESLINLVYWRF